MHRTSHLVVIKKWGLNAGISAIITTFNAIVFAATAVLVVLYTYTQRLKVCAL